MFILGYTCQGFTLRQLKLGCSGSNRISMHVPDLSIDVWSSCQASCEKKANHIKISGCCEARYNGQGYCTFTPNGKIIFGYTNDAKAAICSGM